MLSKGTCMPVVLLALTVTLAGGILVYFNYYSKVPAMLRSFIQLYPHTANRSDHYRSGWNVNYRKSYRSRSPSKKSIVTGIRYFPNVTKYCPGNNPCIAIATTYFFEFKPWKEMIAQPCEYACDYVYDVKEADAVVFNGRDITATSRTEWERHKDQFWVYVNTENPKATVHWGYDVNLDTSYRFVFNWTATYMRNSDIYSPYGEYRHRDVPLDVTDRLYNPRTKRRLAYIVASNCRTYNARKKTVLNLAKHFQIDAFGKCFNRILPYEPDLFKRLSRTYRFYLSFENGYCRDYVTEKLFDNALSTEAVPVVFGGKGSKEYEAVAPPGSFINYDDFDSPQKLAEYLLALAGNETAYAEFFEWKRSYELISRKREDRLLCNVCKKLHTNTTRSVADLHSYSRLDNCLR